ncbi:hypothetical protein A3216_06160 [Mycobacterium leprae 7935681]|nr:hypothetical protein A3216_06160 [Mycobacterium leprae 7935681]
MHTKLPTLVAAIRNYRIGVDFVPYLYLSDLQDQRIDRCLVGVATDVPPDHAQHVLPTVEMYFEHEFPALENHLM